MGYMPHSERVEERDGRDNMSSNVIDLFTRKPPVHARFQDVDEYIEWFRTEGSAEVLVVAGWLEQCEDLDDVIAGLKALRRTINQIKPPAGLT